MRYRLGARTISLALVAGLIAFEAALVLGAGAIGIPGFLLVAGGGRGSHATQGSEGPEGGESVMAKLATATVPATPAPPAGLIDAPPPSDAEPQLNGLAEIPLKTWDRDEPESPQPRAFGQDSKAREVLPWDAVEPVPLDSVAPAATTTPPQPAAPEAPQAVAAPADLPSSGEVEGWVKAKATEVKGEDRARPLYHFEYWLEPPEDMKGRLAAVAYDFNTPAVMPQAQASSERDTGFRVLAGGLTCPDKVTVTLKFKDGRSQQVVVDGCRLLS